MLRLASMIASGPFRVPCSYVVVRSSGTGKITAREVSYVECSSGSPPKLCGGIGVYRVIVRPLCLGFSKFCFAFRPNCNINEAHARAFACKEKPGRHNLPARKLNGEEKGGDGPDFARPDRRSPHPHLSDRSIAN